MILNQTCPWCNQSVQPIHVHGHSQCPVCKTNIDPCCSGEQECIEIQKTVNQEYLFHHD